MYINLNLYGMNSKSKTKSINIEKISIVNSKLFLETLRIITNKNKKLSLSKFKEFYRSKFIENLTWQDGYFLKKKKKGKKKIKANQKLLSNIQLITFIYSSSNKSIISSLITRHLISLLVSIRRILSIHISQIYNISCETFRDYTQEYDAVPRPF